MKRRSAMLLGAALASLSGCSNATLPLPSAPIPSAAPSTTSSASPDAATPVPSRPAATLSPDDAFLDKVPGSIRLMTYNVNWDSIFPEDDPLNHELRAFDREDSFRRILRAVRPDIVCLQEINYFRKDRELADFVERLLGAPEGEVWQVAHVADDLIATRFELREEGYELATGSILTNLDQAAALVDLPDEPYGPTDLYLICSHFKSGGSPDDIRLRLRQADVIMAHVRDFETPGEHLDLPDETPFVILGDFNAYATEPARHLETLFEGDIYDEQRYGVDLNPDWDGTELQDARPSHNGLEIRYFTWRDDSGPFIPGALDRVIFSDSVMTLRNAFVLNTRLLTDEALAAHGLDRDDVLLDPASGNYDHFPVVVDFSMGSTP